MAGPTRPIKAPGAQSLGAWDANANDPTLADGVGSLNTYYVVDTAGTTSIDGEADWGLGDWILFNGTAWQKIDNSEPVSLPVAWGTTKILSTTGGDYSTVADAVAGQATFDTLEIKSGTFTVAATAIFIDKNLRGVGSDEVLISGSVAHILEIQGGHVEGITVLGTGAGTSCVRANDSSPITFRDVIVRGDNAGRDGFVLDAGLCRFFDCGPGTGTLGTVIMDNSADEVYVEGFYIAGYWDSTSTTGIDTSVHTILRNCDFDSYDSLTNCVVNTAAQTYALGVSFSGTNAVDIVSGSVFLTGCKGHSKMIAAASTQLHVRGSYFINHQNWVIDSAAEMSIDFGETETVTTTPNTIRKSTGTVNVNKVAAGAHAIAILAAGFHGTQTLLIRDIQGNAGTTNPITITPAAGTIGGAATYVISDDGGWVFLGKSVSNWEIISEGPISLTHGNTQTLATSGGDYTTFTDAIAGIADWDTLLVMPGTYTFSQETLTAGKSIVGLGGREDCILQTTLDVLDNAALEVENGCRLENIYVRGVAAGANRIRLIWFDTPGATDVVYCKNIRTDNGGGTQPYTLLVPFDAHDSYFQTYHNNSGAFGVATVNNNFSGCRFIDTGSGVVYLFNVAGTLSFTDCRFGASGVGRFFYGTSASMIVKISGCQTIAGGTNVFIASGTNNGSFYLTGSDFTGASMSFGHVNADVYAKGNTGYPATGLGTADFGEVDPGLKTSTAAAFISLKGWESQLDFTGAIAQSTNPADPAFFGTPYLLCKDAEGTASANNKTIGPPTGTIDGAASYVIDDDYGWVLLVLNDAGNGFNVASSSKFHTPADVKTLATGGGDYQTFTAAIADIANWETLLVAPGTYTFTSETLTAGKSIIGLGGREDCILQTDLNVLDNTALEVENGCRLENLYIRGTSGSTTRIRLIWFDTPGASDLVYLNNVRTDGGIVGGGHYTTMLVPMDATDCYFDVSLQTGTSGAMGSIASPCQFFSCTFALAGNGSEPLFDQASAAGDLVLTGCRFRAPFSSSMTVFRATADADIRVSGCTFDDPMQIVLDATDGQWHFAGNDFDAGTFDWDNVAADVYMQGNTDYGAITGPATFHDLDVPLNVKRLAEGGGDYTTFSDAIADIANWDTLEVYPGTYTFTSETLTAGKSIIGIGGREDCILQTDLDTLDNDALEVENGCRLENLYIRGVNGGSNRIRLIWFDTPGVTDVVYFENVRTDTGGGTQPYTLLVPMDAQGCYFDLRGITQGYMAAVNAPSWFRACKFIQTATIGNQHVFEPQGTSGDLYFEGCHFIESAGSAPWVESSNAAVVMFSGCNFVGGAPIINDATAGLYYVAGCNLGGGNLDFDNVAAYVNLTGNTDYGAVTGPATFVEMDVGLVYVATGATYTVEGWESRIEVDRNGGGVCAITLADIDGHGTPTLEIVSTDEAAAPSHFTVAVSGAGQNIGIVTAAEGDTSYTSTARYESVVFGRDTTNNLWTIQSIQPPKDVVYEDDATALTIGKTYYDAAGTWTEVDANTQAKVTGRLVMALGATPRAGLLLMGQVIAEVWATNGKGSWTTSAEMYCSHTATGKITSAAVVAGDYERIVATGLAATDDIQFGGWGASPRVVGL